MNIKKNKEKIKRIIDAYKEFERIIFYLKKKQNKIIKDSLVRSENKKIKEILNLIKNYEDREK